MLQQTGVKTMVPYFQRWMERFPNVQSLALAKEQEALELWQGLGYYRRARNLHEGAKQISNSAFPEDLKGWRAIAGVGPYTASAIASIALNLPTATVDGNIERVFARLSASDLKNRDRTRAAWQWADSNLLAAEPGTWNQALMELGATVCTPRNPTCSICPVSSHCQALRHDVVDCYPVPNDKPKMQEIHFETRIVESQGMFGVRQIPKGGWWEGLWEFPNWKSTSVADPLNNPWQGDRPGIRLPIVKHTVTNHRLTYSSAIIPNSFAWPTLTWLRPEQLDGLPLPAAQRKIWRLTINALGTEDTNLFYLERAESNFGAIHPGG